MDEETTPPWTAVRGSNSIDEGERPPSEPNSEARRIRRADGLLVLSDFDGTLADIRPRPDEARIRPESREALSALAERPRTAVAVVSGRGLADVRERVGLEGIGYAGNHGLEIETPGRRFVHPEAAGVASTIAAVCADLRERLDDVDGAIVEGKDLSATVHYRQVAKAEVDRVRGAVREVLDRHASRGPPVEEGSEMGALCIEEGKEIVELKPDVDWDKGRAVEWLRDVLVPDGESWHPVYVGDDVTDEDAFRALSGRGTTVRVGSPDVPTSADYLVDGPARVPPLFEWIAAVHGLGGRRSGER